MRIGPLLEPPQHWRTYSVPGMKGDRCVAMILKGSVISVCNLMSAECFPANELVISCMLEL